MGESNFTESRLVLTNCIEHILKVVSHFRFRSSNKLPFRMTTQLRLETAVFKTLHFVPISLSAPLNLHRIYSPTKVRQVYKTESGITVYFTYNYSVGYSPEFESHTHWCHF